MSLQILQSVEDILVEKGKKAELLLSSKFCRLWGAQGRECEILFFRQRQPLNHSSRKPSFSALSSTFYPMFWKTLLSLKTQQISEEEAIELKQQTQAAGPGLG